MSHNADFERCLLSLDQEKLEDFLRETALIAVRYLSYQRITAELACHAAAKDQIDDLKVTVELDNQGVL